VLQHSPTFFGLLLLTCELVSQETADLSLLFKCILCASFAFKYLIDVVLHGCDVFFFHVDNRVPALKSLLCIVQVGLDLVSYNALLLVHIQILHLAFF